jgi:hypothetical protein
MPHHCCTRRPRGARRARRNQSEGAWARPQGSPRPTRTPSATRAASHRRGDRSPGAHAHLVHASRSGARVRPTIVGGKRDQGAIAPHAGTSVPSGHATPRSNQEVPGASVTETETAFRSEEVRGDRSRVRFTSRVTGLRPTGLVTVGAAAVIEFISVTIALRYRGAISRFRAVRPCCLAVPARHAPDA